MKGERLGDTAERSFSYGTEEEGVALPEGRRHSDWPAVLAGVEARGSEKVGQESGHLTQRGGGLVSVADDLTMIKDEAQRIGQNSNQGQHHQRTGLMDGGLLEMGLGGEGLERFGVYPPAAATQLMDKGGRDRAQLQVAGVIIRTLFADRLLRRFVFRTSFGSDLEAASLPDAGGLDDAEGAIRHGPIDFRCVPELEFLLGGGPARLGLTAREPLGFGEQIGLIFFQGDHPLQIEIFHLLDKPPLQVQRIGHQQIQKPAAQLSVQQTGRFDLAVHPPTPEHHGP